MPALGAAQFDHVRALAVARDAPIEAVAAEIDQPPAAAGVGGERIERARRVVFGMRAGQHGAVRRQQFGALVVEVLVGEDVERQVLRVEPRQQVRIGRVVPQAGAAGVVER